MAVLEKAHRRDQMLEVAARLFSERGYHGTSMQHLAEGLGILRGSLYAHIASKEDLLFEIVDRGADRFIERAEQIASSESGAAQKLRMAIGSHVEIVAGHKDASTVFLNDWKFLSGKRRRVVESKRDRYEAIIRDIIEAGISSGELAPGLDPKFAAIQVLSIMNWVYQWYDPQGAMSPQQIAEVFGEMVLDGFARTKGAT